MNIYNTIDIPKIDRNIACIGYFDGVHIGHQKLIRKTVELSKEKGLIPLVITFYPDPESVIKKTNIKQITTLERRLELFENYGINNCLLIEFNEELMHLSPNEFIDKYLLNANIDTLICGFDFTFGINASGNIELLKKHLNIIEIPEIKYKQRKVSSSYIKELLEDNNIELAIKLLGHE